MSLAESLYSLQKKSIVKNNIELRYYYHNKYLLSALKDEYNSKIFISPFEIIKRNALIKMLANKNAIDKFYTSLITTLTNNNIPVKDTELEIVTKLRCKFFENIYFFNYDNTEIYIPLFDKMINEIYKNDYYRFIKYPYNLLFDNYLELIIDPFEYYSYYLFESNYFSLIKIGEDKTTRAYYSDPFKAIFIITDQGTLDMMIPLFDRYLKYIDTLNLPERVKAVVEAYYKSNKNAFIVSLYSNNFLSRKAMLRLLK